MFQWYIDTILKDVVCLAFPQKNLTNFLLSVVPSERKSFHAKYEISTKTIYIYNLSRNTNYILSSALHELAHHVDFMLNNQASHGDSFYKCYYQILNTAIDLGIIDTAQLKKATDVRDIRVLEKKCGLLKTKPNNSINKKKNLSVLVIKSGYNDVKYLKEKKYYFEPINCYWYKTISNDYVLKEMTNLKNKFSTIKIDCYPYYNVPINAIYYVIAESTYEKRELLKKRGYKYDTTKYPKKWIKKIDSDNYESETIFLKKNHFKFVIKNNLNFSKKTLDIKKK